MPVVDGLEPERGFSDSALGQKPLDLPEKFTVIVHDGEYSGTGHIRQWDVTHRVPNGLANGTLPLMSWEYLRDQIRYFMKHEAGGQPRAKPFTQKSLALAAGRHATAVRDILKGRSKNPKADTLTALSTTLGVDLPVLLNKSVDINQLESEFVHSGVGSRSPRKDGREMDALRVRLAMEIGRLPEDQLPVVEKIINVLQSIGTEQPARPQKPGKTG